MFNENQFSLFNFADPEMGKFDFTRCHVKSINHQTASRIVETYHYAHRTPSIVVAFGLYVDDTLAGVITYGIPANKNTLSCCGEQYNENGLELNRLFVFDWCGRNTESWFIGQTFKLLEKYFKQYFILVSYADAGHEHTGYIYQATNWIYTGVSKGDTEWIIDGERYHRKNVYNEFGTSSVQGVKDMGKNVEILRQGDKFRYVFFLGSKSQKKKLLGALRWQVLPYPKGRNLTPREPDKRDSSPSQAFSQPEFLSDLEGLS